MESNGQTEQDVLNSSQTDRRKFMEKAGKLAAFTPPVIMGLMLPGQHAIASGTFGDGNDQGENNNDQGGWGKKKKK